VSDQAKLVQTQAKRLQASVIQDLGYQMLKIDRWMADHPEYLEAIKRPDAEESACGAAVAEVYADFIDQVVSQDDLIPPEHIEAWNEYFRDIIEMWPQLKKYMRDNPRWYLETMNQLLLPPGH
jgi:hypothetical protein